MEKSDRNSNFKLFCEAISPDGTVIDGLNPCLVSYKGRRIYVYIKNLTPAQLSNNNPDVWRVQLPKRNDFDKIKDSDEIFLLLGYDADGDVYATWNPYWVKQRLNVGESVSLYSRKSLQDETCIDETIRCATLNHDSVVVLFPRFKIKEYIDNIADYFPEITEYKAVGSSLRKKSIADGPITEENNMNLITPELYHKILPLMDRDEPDEIGALQILSDYYGDSLNETMTFQDWINLLHARFEKLPGGCNDDNSVFNGANLTVGINPGELLEGSDVSVYLNKKGPLKKNAIGQAVVKEYLLCFPETKYLDLKNIFPDSFLGPRWYGFKMLQEDIAFARDYSNNRLKKKRHLIFDDQILESGDGIRFVVSNQWDYRNIPNLFPIIRKCGMELWVKKKDGEIVRIVGPESNTKVAENIAQLQPGENESKTPGNQKDDVLAVEERDLAYYCNCVTELWKIDCSTKSRLIMFLSMMDYVHTSPTIDTNIIPLLYGWEGVFLRYFKEYGIGEKRESTAFSTPFILLGDQPYWRLIKNNDCQINSVRALKTFQKLQEMYEGVEIDQELFTFISRESSYVQLKNHIMRFLK